MKGRRFFHSRQLVAAQQPPPPPNPKRTGIQINWREGAAMTIKIQHRHIELVTKAVCINLNPPAESRAFAFIDSPHSKPDKQG
jgi:hypothetical protein